MGEVFPKGGGLARRDVLCHAKPKDAEQAAVWKKLVEYTLGPPDTREVALSAGKDKRENFEWLLPHRPAIGRTGAAEKLTALFFMVSEVERLRMTQAGADIELRNSMLDFDFDKRLIKSSMASTVERGLRTFRSTHTRLNSSGGRSSSSLRVPER